MFKSAPGKSAQGGFTLIELVVVIVILGILAAFAVPRFARLDGNARAASVRSLEGSLRSASAMTHGLWLASGNNPPTVPMEGGVNIAMTAAGYPAATAAGIRATLPNDAYSPANPLIPGRFTTTIAGNVITFRIVGAPNTSNNCLVNYTQTAVLNAMPTITSNVGAC